MCPLQPAVSFGSSLRVHWAESQVGGSRVSREIPQYPRPIECQGWGSFGSVFASWGSDPSPLPSEPLHSKLFSSLKSQVQFRPVAFFPVQKINGKTGSKCQVSSKAPRRNTPKPPGKSKTPSFLGNANDLLSRYLDMFFLRKKKKKENEKKNMKNKKTSLLSMGVLGQEQVCMHRCVSVCLCAYLPVYALMNVHTCAWL